MTEMMVELTFSSSNAHEVVDDNGNMIIDALRINQGYADQHPIVNEEPNTDTTMFFF